MSYPARVVVGQATNNGKINTTPTLDVASDHVAAVANLPIGVSSDASAPPIPHPPNSKLLIHTTFSPACLG